MQVVRAATEEWRAASLVLAEHADSAGRLAAASMLARGLPGTGLFRALYVIPWICSPLAVAVLWRWVFEVDGGTVVEDVVVLDDVVVDGDHPGKCLRHRDASSTLRLGASHVAVIRERSPGAIGIGSFCGDLDQQSLFCVYHPQLFR